MSDYYNQSGQDTTRQQGMADGSVDISMANKKGADNQYTGYQSGAGDSAYNTSSAGQGQTYGSTGGYNNDNSNTEGGNNTGSGLGGLGQKVKNLFTGGNKSDNSGSDNQYNSGSDNQYNTGSDNQYNTGSDNQYSSGNENKSNASEAMGNMGQKVKNVVQKITPGSGSGNNESGDYNSTGYNTGSGQAGGYGSGGYTSGSGQDGSYQQSGGIQYDGTNQYDGSNPPSVPYTSTEEMRRNQNQQSSNY